MKVMQVPRDIKQISDGFDSLVSAIVQGTNWQNAIKPSDLITNDRRQIELERELRKCGYLYLRKSQTKGEAKITAGNKYMRLIKKDELAQAIAGCELDPYFVRAGKEKLFGEDFYTSLFPNADPNYYLPRYWLMKEVAYCAKGYPERAYAKWLALGFVWSYLNPLVKSKKNAEVFRRKLEKQEEAILKLLHRAINAVFNGTIRYYRKNRGTGTRALDPSAFFQK